MVVSELTILVLTDTEDRVPANRLYCSLFGLHVCGKSMKIWPNLQLELTVVTLRTKLDSSNMMSGIALVARLCKVFVRFRGGYWKTNVDDPRCCQNAKDNRRLEEKVPCRPMRQMFRQKPREDEYPADPRMTECQNQATKGKPCSEGGKASIFETWKLVGICRSAQQKQRIFTSILRMNTHGPS